MILPSEFWDVLAPHHDSLEQNYFNVPSLRRIIHEIHSPVLVVGAGQGLIVEELLKKGFRTDGVDLSREMIRYAESRRGILLIEADAGALPFGSETYETIIYATGVVDFMADEDQIRVILQEGRRTIRPSGKIFVAFYKLSGVTEAFLGRLGLLKDNVLAFRETLEIYRMTPFQAISWVKKRAGVGFIEAVGISFRAWVFSTMNEKKAGFHMQRIFKQEKSARALTHSAPEKQPYRNEPEIRNLFRRLGIPIKNFLETASCWMVQI